MRQTVPYTVSMIQNIDVFRCFVLEENIFKFRLNFRRSKLYCHLPYEKTQSECSSEINRARCWIRMLIKLIINLWYLPPYILNQICCENWNFRTKFFSRIDTYLRLYRSKLNNVDMFKLHNCLKSWNEPHVVMTNIRLFPSKCEKQNSKKRKVSLL